LARARLIRAIEKARISLALAKTNGPQVTEVIQNVVNNRGSAVVFCAHRAASAVLRSKLSLLGISSNLVDGRTSATKRLHLEDQFQAGKFDVLIGSLKVAGESINLTRADTVIFVELDWVPAAMLQAEDRIHRQGQSSAPHIIHLIAKISAESLDEYMIDVLESKLKLINDVLSEDHNSIVGEIATGSIRNIVVDRIVNCKKKHIIK